VGLSAIVERRERDEGGGGFEMMNKGANQR